jgi:hypothetical protein
MDTPTPRTDAFIGNQDGTYMTEANLINATKAFIAKYSTP